MFPEGESEQSHSDCKSGGKRSRGDCTQNSLQTTHLGARGLPQRLGSQTHLGMGDVGGLSKSWALTTPFLPFEHRRDNRQIFTPQAKKQSIRHWGNWQIAWEVAGQLGRAGAQSSAFWGPSGMACFCPAHAGVTTSKRGLLYKQTSQLCHGNILNINGQQGATDIWGEALRRKAKINKPKMTQDETNNSRDKGYFKRS